MSAGYEVGAVQLSARVRRRVTTGDASTAGRGTDLTGRVARGAASRLMPDHAEANAQYSEYCIDLRRGTLRLQKGFHALTD
jgi:hypothetical protein